MGANWANEVGQVKAILIAQGSGYESEELGVGYGHESECVQSSVNSAHHLLCYVIDGSSTLSSTPHYRW
jgi:hypothetical protein